jgi:hypothetical protein
VGCVSQCPVPSDASEGGRQHVACVHCLWHGHCSLAIGSADVDELEDTLERGDKHLLSSKEAVEAHTVLAMGVLFFLGVRIRVVSDPLDVCSSHILLRPRKGICFHPGSGDIAGGDTAFGV